MAKLNIKSRSFLYHYYNHTDFAALPAWSAARMKVPIGSDPLVTEFKSMYSLKKDMDQLRSDGAANDSIVDASQVTLGTSYGNNDLAVLKVGKGSAHKVLFLGCHHAREWISVEIPYLVAEYLIQSYTKKPKTVQEKRIYHLLQNREIWFVPLVNPDGHLWTMTQNRNWRPNLATYWCPAGKIKRGSVEVKYPDGLYTGVDINRNYGTSNWGTETFDPAGNIRTSTNPADGGLHGIWCGLGKSSEPETKLIDNLIQTEKFRASISYHSHGQDLLYPDASATDTFVQYVGKGMLELINASGNPYTYESGSALYPTTGDSMEFTYEKVAGRPTFTPEVRPTLADAPVKGFSFLPESEIEGTFKENLGAALALINCAGFDKPAGTYAVAHAPGVPAPKAQVVLNCWDRFKGWTP